MKKRICAMLLVMCLAVGMMPNVAFADEAIADETVDNEAIVVDENTTDDSDVDENDDTEEVTEEATETEPAIEEEGSVIEGTEVGIPRPVADELESLKLSLRGSTAVRLGNHIYMHVKISGLAAPVKGAKANWYVNGKRIKAASFSSRTLKNGDQLDLKYKLPKSTERELNKVTLKISKSGCNTQYITTYVETVFDFAGASLKPSEKTSVNAGNTRRVKMTLNGMKKPIKGTVTWYVDGKKKSTIKNAELKNGKTFVYSLTTKKTETGTRSVKIILSSADGRRTLSRTKKITVVGQYDKLISSYSTSFDPSQKGRSTNLRLAMKSINGTVVNPGATFSYNKVVGERTSARGYQIGYIYSNGQVVPGIGGGVCQVSSTLFNTVLLANMGIVERRCHSLTVSYVPLGRDATVLWGHQDFKFKNTSKYPIKLVTVYDAGGRLTIKLMSSASFKTPNVRLTVTRGSGYTLKRYVDGKLNYTTYSSYGNQ